MSGHLYVVQTDPRMLACDAWLLPTDRFLNVSEGWGPELKQQVSAIARPDRWGGDIRALPLDSGNRPEVWIADTGGSGSKTFDWYRDAVIQFLDGAVARNGQARQLVALPPVGIGGGGHRSDKWVVLPELVRLLAEEAEQRDVDIALVTRASDDFAAAQVARRNSERWRGLHPDVIERARALGAAAVAGRLVLFLGAGVSNGAGLPGWDSLLTELAREAHLESQLDRLAQLSPLDRARVIEGRLAGVEQRTLRSYIVERMSTPRHSLAHALLASLPVREAATTNYDRLLEQAAEAIGRPFAVLPYESAQTTGRWLLKLHGSIDRPEDIVITRQDYLRYDDRRSALAGILQALLITREMLFVGFSLTDDNFLRVADSVRKAVSEDSASKDRFGTALFLDANEITEMIWQDEIEFVSLAEPRLVDVFLDCVLHYASLGSEHLLDPAFGGMLTDPERELASRLAQLGQLTGEVRALPAWQLVEELLQRFGADNEQ